MSHTCKNAAHIPGMCGKPAKKTTWCLGNCPGKNAKFPEDLVPGKVRNFRSIFGMYTNNLVGKCLE